jgi:nucleotide-binding universal stress UspA family protein
MFKKSDPALKKKVEGNLLFAKKYLQQHEIDYDITTEKGKHSFPEETIDFAKEINADIILIMTSRNLGFADFVMGPDEQSIISNSAKIPVMCINPRPVNFSGSFRASGG